jgi:hypothetical protein
MTTENQKPLNEDNFEISFRILGNEFFGMKISSESRAKNWAFFGVLTLVAMAVLVNEIGPALVSMVNAIQ